MARGLRQFLAGSVVAVGLGTLAACSGGSFLSDREPWRKEAEARCMGSGAVREGVGITRISPINGPGVCGADFPLRVSALGSPAALSFNEELRPPGAIPGAGKSATPSRWPIVEPGIDAPRGPARSPVEVRPLSPPAGAAAAPDIDDRHRPSGPPQRSPVRPEPVDLTNYDLSPEPYDRRRLLGESRAATPREPRIEAVPAQTMRPPVRDSRRVTPLGSSRPRPITTGTVAVTPNATLACPMVSALDEWIAGAVQPAAMRWFGQPVVEIKQISAYSCRGMNGNPRARISEHAFGNALDIASFALADGRRITVKDGWRGAPEEQGFLRDVQGAACDRFTTVLAPGSNVFHYDHMHVDLMRRANGYRACNPRAVSGEEVAARARAQYARQGRDVTGSVDSRRKSTPPLPSFSPRDKVGHQLPLAIPGEDGED